MFINIHFLDIRLHTLSYRTTHHQFKNPDRLQFFQLFQCTRHPGKRIMLDIISLTDLHQPDKNVFCPRRDEGKNPMLGTLYTTIYHISCYYQTFFLLLSRGVSFNEAAVQQSRTWGRNRSWWVPRYLHRCFEPPQQCTKSVQDINLYSLNCIALTPEKEKASPI